MFCAPRSSTCLIVTTSPIGTRTTGRDRIRGDRLQLASTDSSPLGECSMSMSIQSMPAPAQISATSGLPEQTQMPARGRDAVAERVAEGGSQMKRQSITPIGP